MVMSRRKLMRIIDSAKVKDAIEAAERRTSGEIAVSVSPVFWGDVRTAAQKAFERMGMTRTRERNGVLIFVVPARRRFVVLGDSGMIPPKAIVFPLGITKLRGRHGCRFHRLRALSTRHAASHYKTESGRFRDSGIRTRCYFCSG